LNKFSDSTNNYYFGQNSNINSLIYKYEPSFYQLCFHNKNYLNLYKINNIITNDQFCEFINKNNIDVLSYQIIDVINHYKDLITIDNLNLIFSKNQSVFYDILYNLSKINLLDNFDELTLQKFVFMLGLSSFCLIFHEIHSSGNIDVYLKKNRFLNENKYFKLTENFLYEIIIKKLINKKSMYKLIDYSIDNNKISNYDELFCVLRKNNYILAYDLLLKKCSNKLDYKFILNVDLSKLIFETNYLGHRMIINDNT